jgi:hypothetical protein
MHFNEGNALSVALIALEHLPSSLITNNFFISESTMWTCGLGLVFSEDIGS